MSRKLVIKRGILRIELVLWIVPYRMGHQVHKNMSASTLNKDKQARDDLHAMLLSSVSHDLKTPLACVIGSLDIYQQLKNTLSEERKNALISTAIKEARRLDSFITNILDMAKLESDILFKYEYVDMGQLVRQCVLRMQPVLSQHDVHLELSLQGMVEVNELWITRALTILLENAALYTQVDTKIVVAAGKEGESCWICVRDYGSGISKRMQSSIFHKHSRAARLDAKIAGTGLGLPICKAIAQRHGGTVCCDIPLSGAGVAFTLTVPLVQSKAKIKKRPV